MLSTWSPNFILVATEAAMTVGGFLWALEQGQGTLSQLLIGHIRSACSWGQACVAKERG